MIQFLKYNWKLLTVTVLLLSIGIYAGRRVQLSFRDQGPPEWQKLTERRTPSAPSAVCKQFRALLEAVQQSAPATQRLRALSLLELGEEASESVLWCTERALNAGYQDQINVETLYNSDPYKLIGYYTLEGEPLKYTTRFNPNYPQSMPVTIHLRVALTPGESRLLIRRERHSVDLSSASSREFQLSLQPAVWKRGPGLQACGIYLGSEAKVTSYKPKTGVVTAGTALVGWLDPNTPVSVAFARP